VLELDREGREAVLELRALHQPLRDVLRSRHVVESGEIDALLLQLLAELRLHLLVEVAAHAGLQELLRLGGGLAPAGVRLDRLGDRVERIHDDLELEEVRPLFEHAHVLVIVVHRGDVEGRHHVDDRSHGVRVLPPLVPVAVGHAVAVGVGLRRVGEVPVELLEVREAVLVRVGIASRNEEEERADEDRVHGWPENWKGERARGSVVLRRAAAAAGFEHQGQFWRGGRRPPGPCPDVSSPPLAGAA
jgi:hypothetical protein